MPSMAGNHGKQQKPSKASATELRPGTLCRPIDLKPALDKVGYQSTVLGFNVAFIFAKRLSFMCFGRELKSFGLFFQDS